MKKIFTLCMVWMLLAGISHIPLVKQFAESITKYYDNEVVEEIPNVEPVKEVRYFGEDITFDFTYQNNDSTQFSYSLITPSTAKTSDEPIPLIVYLHGKGDLMATEAGFENRNMAKLLSEWTLQGFNAYVMCPSLMEPTWTTTNVRDQLKATLDAFFATHNVDRNKVIICGHSLGGQGTLYLAYELQDYFSAQVIFSGYNVDVAWETIAIPTRIYCGREGSEDPNSFNTTISLSQVFGEENTTVLNKTGQKAEHYDSYRVAFSIDDDGDGISDLVKWMLDQSKAAGYHNV